MTNKQKVFGGIGVAIILLLVFVKRVKSAPVLEEEVVIDEYGEEQEKSTSGGGGGGFQGGVTPVNVAPSPTTTVVLPVQTVPTMNIGSPTAPYAVGSTASDAPPMSSTTTTRETPPAPPAPATPSIPAATSPIPAPVKDTAAAAAVKFTNFLDFDGISQKSKMDLLL
jgi:hypothetical protein